MTVLIIGKAGQLADNLAQLLTERGPSYVQLGQEDIDLAVPGALALPLQGVDVVFNCAAYTNVDGAESDETTAANVNGRAVGVIAEQCRKAGIPLVHFSTDYVFDGQATQPYRTDEPRAPVGAYGRTKALGEELLEASGADFLLVRTSWVYAPLGKNFVRTIAQLCREKDELKVVSDQRGRPTHARSLAERSLALYERGERGIFHITDEGECSWFEFACAIRDAVQARCEIHPCTTQEFPRPAPRPPYSVLDTSRADTLLGPAVHYQRHLQEMAEGLKGL